MTDRPTAVRECEPCVAAAGSAPRPQLNRGTRVRTQPAPVRRATDGRSLSGWGCRHAVIRLNRPTKGPDDAHPFTAVAHWHAVLDRSFRPRPRRREGVLWGRIRLVVPRPRT